MTANWKLGSTLGRMIGGSAVVLLVGGAQLLLTPAAQAADAGYIRVVTEQGPLDGGSKEAGHMNWIAVSSVVSGDLDGDAMADREASAPSVSEVTATKANIGSQSSGSGAGKVVAPRDAASGMASGKRMHKPFVVTKEVDAASPLLMKASSSGQHLKEVDLDMSGHHYTLSNVVITSDQTSRNSAHAVETLSMTYEKIEMK